MGDESKRSHREELGHELESAIESLVFNLEHGVPQATVQRFEQLVEELSARLGRDSSLTGELRPFHSAVARLCRAPDAVDDLLRHGGRLVALLVPPAR